MGMLRVIDRVFILIIFMLIMMAIYSRLNIDDYVTHNFGLEDINKAFHLMHAGKSIRSVIHFN